MIDVAVAAVRVEGDDGVGARAANQRDQRAADLHGRGRRESLILIRQEHDLGDPHRSGGVPQLLLAHSRELVDGRERRVADRPTLAPCGTAERDVRPLVGVAAHRPRGEEALVVRMREAEQE